MAAKFVPITLRLEKGTPLTYAEADANFRYLQKQMPIGGLLEYPLVTDYPDTFLPCDGTALRQDEYPDLYSVIGHTFDGGPEGTFPWGPGEDADTHFRIPYYLGLFTRTYDPTGNYDEVRPPNTYQADAFKAHNHRSGFYDFTDWLSGSRYQTVSADQPDNESQKPYFTENTGDTETRPKNVVTMLLIKYGHEVISPT